ncbi:hypothetical protein ACFTWS_06005 [Streptomyces sp. NPDC057027]|uniref:hypothetical protein n=1 Tax=Streptomyces sp. NPDC057027 TaxID=3346004 RepID=UPI0036436323
METDIDEVRAKYGDTCDKRIADVVESPKKDREFQAMPELRGWTIDCDILKRSQPTRKAPSCGSSWTRPAAWLPSGWA